MADLCIRCGECCGDCEDLQKAGNRYQCAVYATRFNSKHKSKRDGHLFKCANIYEALLQEKLGEARCLASIHCPYRKQTEGLYESTRKH